MLTCCHNKNAQLWLLFLSEALNLLNYPIYIYIYTHTKKKSFFLNFSWTIILHLQYRGCPRGVMVKAMDCGIVVSEFVLQSCYYVHFRANTLGKGMNPLILPAMG